MTVVSKIPQKICVLVSKPVMLDYAVWRAIVDEDIREITFVFFDFDTFQMFSKSKITHKLLQSKSINFSKGFVLPFGHQSKDLKRLSSFLINILLRSTAILENNLSYKILFYLKILSSKRYRVPPGFDEVWITWSKMTRVENNLINMLSRNGMRCHFVPDALVAEKHTMGQTQDRVISEHKPFFVVHNKWLAKATLADNKIPEKMLITKRFKEPEIIKPQRNQKQFNILFLAQKTIGEDWEATSFSSQTLRISKLFELIRDLELHQNVNLYFRQRPLPEHDENLRKLKGFYSKLDCNFFDASKHSLFDCILAADFIISEFTSAFVYSRGTPLRFMYMDKGVEEVMKRFPVVRSQYSKDIRVGAIVDESAILGRLKLELTAYKENR